MLFGDVDHTTRRKLSIPLPPCLSNPMDRFWCDRPLPVSSLRSGPTDRDFGYKDRGPGFT